jgi:SAM-dependent methyltransferase
MLTDYNTMATRYQHAKEQPWRAHVERYTWIELLGDLSGKSALDLACGEGYLTRLLKQLGAERVVGVDLSEAMIGLARQEEARQPLGIEYLVQDARQVEVEPGGFDLVTAGYLLNYAQTPAELRAMCAAVARSLKPGGRFVSVNNNPAQPPETFAAGEKYGFNKQCDAPRQEGAPIRWRFLLDDGVLEVTNYQLSIPTHEAAFHAAGLRDVRWHTPRLAPAGAAEYGQEFWADFLEAAPIIFIECAK